MNYSFSGAGTIPGGEYEKVSAAGSAKLAGNVRCQTFAASGALAGSGSIVCSGDMRVSGSTGIDGDISAGVLKSSGAFRCNALSGGELHCSGAVRVKGNMQADSIHASGSLNCSGLVSADFVEIKMNGTCSAGSIGGGEIRILPDGSGGAGFVLFRHRHAAGSMKVSESIEGDELYLENVTCPAVTGRRVTIGPGCRIGAVVYSESAEVSPDAAVDACRQE